MYFPVTVLPTCGVGTHLCKAFIYVGYESLFSSIDPSQSYPNHWPRPRDQTDFVLALLTLVTLTLIDELLVINRLLLLFIYSYDYFVIVATANPNQPPPSLS